ncbi:hypothetical protein Tco_1091589 [Tanacetum coccineum]|uniref:Uncharacterized protein n=1 Tax=Tanacetum coccineum TaxID=301880 RepID=A0ABQ5I8M4_9ASTR
MKKLSKSSLMSSRTQPATRHLLSLLKSLKSLCSSSGTLLRRVQGEDFTEVPDDESSLTFLINLGYKGPLHKHPIMFVDHMHQPWETLAAIINKCLSSKDASNDMLRKSRIDILWGMFYRENIDYSELIWEDFTFQIDHRIEKQRRRKIIPYPRFTKNIINHFLSQHKSLAKLKHLHTHTIKDDGIVNRLKFVRIDVHKYSTDLIPLNKSRGKGSQGNKVTVSPKPASVEVSEEPDFEPTRKQTGSRRVIKKKVSISVEDNIILEPDVALELAKSMSLTRAKEEAARCVHSTHERLVTKSDEPSNANKPTGRRSTTGVVIQDTLNVAKKKSVDQSQKLKGIQTLTPKEYLTADMMQSLKASRKTNISQSLTGGSSEGTSVSPGVPDESIVVFSTSDKGTGDKPRVPDEAHRKSVVDVTLN